MDPQVGPVTRKRFLQTAGMEAFYRPNVFSDSDEWGLVTTCEVRMVEMI